MDDYGYQQQHASLYPVPYNALALYDPYISTGLFSDQGLLQSYDQLIQYDPFHVQPDQLSCHSMVVNEGFDQFDPLYPLLDFPNQDTPLSPSIPLQVCGRPSFGSSESVGTDILESPLLWSNELVTNRLDNGVALLCSQLDQPMQVIRDVVPKECEIIEGEKYGAKNDSTKSGSKKNRKRSRKTMENDSSGNSNNSVTDSLTWEILSQYFYMPIAKAARELNIGLTLFKKKCRELGVRRWPHRKLMSIQSLIKNVKEMENDGAVNPAISKRTVRNAIELLEKQMKTMEVMPDTELETQTKRLRQACFKANYKKRRLMVMNGGCLDNFSGNSCNESCGHNEMNAQEMEDSYELKSLLFDSPSPADCSFLNDYNI